MTVSIRQYTIAISQCSHSLFPEIEVPQGTPPSMTRLVVVAALKSELHADRGGDGVDVIYGGVGKINTATAILTTRPTPVVNYVHLRQDLRKPARPAGNIPCGPARHDGDTVGAARRHAVV
jgi:hypothetical protein